MDFVTPSVPACVLCMGSATTPIPSTGWDTQWRYVDAFWPAHTTWQIAWGIPPPTCLQFKAKQCTHYNRRLQLHRACMLWKPSKFWFKKKVLERPRRPKQLLKVVLNWGGVADVFSAAFQTDIRCRYSVHHRHLPARWQGVILYFPKSRRCYMWRINTLSMENFHKYFLSLLSGQSSTHIKNRHLMVPNTLYSKNCSKPKFYLF